MRLILASASKRRVGLLKKAGLKFEVCPSLADETKVTACLPPVLAAERARLKAEEVFARLYGCMPSESREASAANSHCAFPESGENSAVFAPSATERRKKDYESKLRMEQFLQSAAANYDCSRGEEYVLKSNVQNSDRLIVLGADTVVAKDGEIFNKPRCAAEAVAMLKKLSGSTHRVYTAFCVLSDKIKVERCEETVVTFGVFGERFLNDYVKSGKPFDKAGGYGIQDEEIEPFVLEIDGDRDNVIGLPVTAVLNILKEKF